ncbi:glycosyltransferase [Phormidesmis priestleyi ULC007]|uniref:Glycosyltransferase n=1 Tax=Phormidesmis priestleyi ULC007 TaxID=1920490 RepID=A0A2T1DFK5_9CYAN|nr:glycosyltransferase [Phormidesmis priestleyi]PSB19300.1 glycosyltransferase [Phormidesmis priestleyi ULC007]PZO52185.1 MAG: glycosyltransferase [Phormidesmis priestleyi]
MRSDQAEKRFLPKISVIVPIYNGEADLPGLLHCLRAQTYSSDLVSYCLVDNGSHDRTSEILKSASQDAQNFVVLSESQIQSSYAARNLGIRSTTGEILVFTDADCRPEPNWLENLIQPFEDLTVGLVAGEIKALLGNTILEQHADRQETLSQKHTLAHPFCAYGQTANLAVRDQVFEQVGLFRPYLTTGGDADFCWRALSQTPWQIRFAERAIVRHRHRSTLAALRSQWRRYGRSNRYLHELHGVDLMRDFSLQDYGYRLTRWLFKELPIAAIHGLQQKATLADLFSTPIGLICAHARTTGQRHAHLPDQARQIEWLHEPKNS